MSRLEFEKIKQIENLKIEDEKVRKLEDGKI